MLLAMATGIVGTISILKGQSLIGDAVGHASLPGIILAFMISGRKSSLILMIGAIVAGIVAFILIQIIAEGSKIEADTAMAVILSAMFGMGMVLKSYIQGNPKYQGASQSGLASYIFGQAAYILREDVYIILAVSVISLALFIVFYKEIKVYVFDSLCIYNRDKFKAYLSSYNDNNHDFDCGRSKGGGCHSHKQYAYNTCGYRFAME